MFFQSLKGILSNLTFCVSNSYPKQGTNVCLIRCSIYSTSKTLPIVEEVDILIYFVGLWGIWKHFSLSPQFPGLLFFGWLLTRVMWAAGPAWSNGAVGGCCHGGFPSRMLTSPKIRRETKNAKCQVNESTHLSFRVLFGFYFRRNWTYLFCFFVCMNAFWKQWKLE